MGNCIIPRMLLTKGPINSNVIKFGNTNGRYDPSVGYKVNPTFNGDPKSSRIDKGKTVTKDEFLYDGNTNPIRVKLDYITFYIEISTYETYFTPTDTYGLIGQLVMGETLTCEPIPGLQLKFYIKNGGTLNDRYNEYYCQFCSEMTNNTDYRYVEVSSVPQVMIYYGDYENNQ